MKMKVPKQQYTTEFKELAVSRVREGHSAGAVAKESRVKAAPDGTRNGAGAMVIFEQDCPNSS